MDVQDQRYVRCKPRLHVSVNVLPGVRKSCCATPCRSAYVLATNTPNRSDHEKAQLGSPLSCFTELRCQPIIFP